MTHQVVPLNCARGAKSAILDCLVDLSLQLSGVALAALHVLSVSY